MCIPSRTQLTELKQHSTHFFISLADPDVNYERRPRVSSPVQLVEEVDILLEHVVRVAGGDLDNEVIPPAPTIIDKCLMARKLAGMKAAHDLKNLIQLDKEKELYEAREAAEAARATARTTTPERKVK
jgi:hypothetical protein